MKISVRSTSMYIFFLISYGTGENQRIPKMDKRYKSIACLRPQAALTLSLISWITNCGSAILIPTCFSALAGYFSGPQILNSSAAAVESMKHSVVGKSGKRMAFGIS